MQFELSNASMQAVLTALSNELLCVNTDLRLLYDAYSSRQGQMPWGWGHPEHSAALTSAQLWELLRECDVPEPDCSLAHINLALAEVGSQSSSYCICSVSTQLQYRPTIPMVATKTCTTQPAVKQCACIERYVALRLLH